MLLERNCQSCWRRISWAAHFCSSLSTAVTSNNQGLDVVLLYYFRTGTTQLLVAEFATQLQLPWLPVTRLPHYQASCKKDVGCAQQYVEGQQGWNLFFWNILYSDKIWSSSYSFFFLIQSNPSLSILAWSCCPAPSVGLTCMSRVWRHDSKAGMQTHWNPLTSHRTHCLTHFELQYKARPEHLQVWRQRFFEAAESRDLVSGCGAFSSLPPHIVQLWCERDLIGKGLTDLFLLSYRTH